MICPRCGAPTSDLEPFCENCSWPLPRRIGWGLVLALLLLPGLALGGEAKKEFKILAGATWSCQDGGILRVQDEPYLGWAATIVDKNPEIMAKHKALMTGSEEPWVQDVDGPGLPVRVYERDGEKAWVWMWCKRHDCYKHTVYEGYDLDTGQLFLEITDYNLTLSESIRAKKEGVFIRAAETGDYGEYQDRIRVRTLGEATPTIQAAIRCARWLDAQEQAKTLRR